MIIDLIGWIIFGLIVGAIARFLMPGKDPMGWLATIALGVAGSLLGGLVAGLLFGSAEPGLQASGFIGSLLGAILLLWALRSFSKRSTTT